MSEQFSKKWSGRMGGVLDSDDAPRGMYEVHTNLGMMDLTTNRIREWMEAMDSEDERFKDLVMLFGQIRKLNESYFKRIKSYREEYSIPVIG